MECSNELSAHFAVRHLDVALQSQSVRHLDVALQSVPHHICSIKNSFDLRCESVTYNNIRTGFQGMLSSRMERGENLCCIVGEHFILNSAA